MSDYITFPYEDEEGYRAWLAKQPDDTCPACDGTGEVVNDFGHKVSCPDCAGTGVEELPQRLDDDVI